MTTDNFRALAVEMATQRCSVAACADGKIASREWDAGAEASRLILDWIQAVLDELPVALHELDCLVLGCGPGGFTGLRVGAAAVQGLAYAAGLPVCRISSLAGLAAAAVRRTPQSLVMPAFDARMGQAYAGVYEFRTDGDFRVRVADRLVDPDAVRLSGWLDRPVLAVGSAWAAFPQMAANNRALLAAIDGRLAPSAADLLPLARLRWMRGETLPAAEALPNYVRDDVTD